jgi:hypothetical protein
MTFAFSRMRRYVLAVVIILAMHCAATLLVRPYTRLLVKVGSLFLQATDIADIPGLLLTGFLLVGSVLVLGTIAIAYATRAETP